MYAIINLKPATRMSTTAIQVATLVNEHTAKNVGMVEVLCGGTSSLGHSERSYKSFSIFKKSLYASAKDAGQKSV